jgi:hypothetical protein
MDAAIMGVRWHGSAWIRVALHRTALYREYLHNLSPGAQQRYLREVRTPLMAVGDTHEAVGADGVIYSQPDKLVIVHFNGDGYQTEVASA